MAGGRQPDGGDRASRHLGSSATGDYLLALHTKGAAHATQDAGRDVMLRPGDFALFDSTRPYSIAFTGTGSFEHVIYQVPRASLDARRRRIGAATALRVPVSSGAGQLASPYLRTLPAPGWSADGPVPAQALIDTGLDLVVSALQVAVDSEEDLGPRRGPLGADLKRDALARLGDPGLSPAAVARAIYVSVRQLHRLFAAEGFSFGAWVHEQRLRRCRDDLADAALGHLAIGQIVERWGYCSTAHFTRAFAARFGVTLRDLRRTALHASSPARSVLACSR